MNFSAAIMPDEWLTDAIHPSQISFGQPHGNVPGECPLGHCPSEWTFPRPFTQAAR